MNRDTTKSLHERLITFSLLTSIVVLFATGPMWASTLVVNSSTTTEIISVPRFNQQASQGWLTGVNLRINLQSSSIVGSVGSHNHSLSNPFHVGGTTSSSGIHNHAVNIPTFSGGGLAVQPVGNFNVNSDGLHNHSVNSGALATNSSGAHNHTHSTQTRVHTFSGAGMAPFLGSGTFGLTGSLSSTANVGTHIHSYTVGVNSAGAHSHGYTDRWTTNTTFTFDPNDAPTANANGAYNLIYGNNLTLSGVGSFDPDIPFGDFITQYQWDLDNNSSPNFTTSSPILNLTEAQYSGYFTTPGAHTIGLRVMDSLNQLSTFAMTNVIIPFTPGDGNGDGHVNGLDYLIWAGNFGDDPADDPPGSPENGDFNEDSIVNGLDYLLWASNFGQGQNDATAVPEPGTVLLLAVGLTCLTAVRRRVG